VALDYRRDPAGEPSVAWLDNEVDQDITLARDFRTFLEGLVPMDQFKTDEADPDLPTLHVRRAESRASYCGYSLSDGLTWIAEELFDQRAPNACADCVRLRAEWGLEAG